MIAESVLEIRREEEKLKDQISQTRIQAKNDLEESIKDAQVQAQRILDEAKDQANKLIAFRLKQAEEEAQKILKNSKDQDSSKFEVENLDQLVDYVLERIVT